VIVLEYHGFILLAIRANFVSLVGKLYAQARKILDILLLEV
jgi:hypothetical protein